jgi:DNA-directed RNA polymerase subunit RPC12/RpoP
MIKAKYLHPSDTTKLRHFLVGIITLLGKTDIVWDWKCGNCNATWEKDGPMGYGRHYARCPDCGQRNYGDYKLPRTVR